MPGDFQFQTRKPECVMSFPCPMCYLFFKMSLDPPWKENLNIPMLCFITDLPIIKQYTLNLSVDHRLSRWCFFKLHKGVCVCVCVISVRVRLRVLWSCLLCHTVSYYVILCHTMSYYLCHTMCLFCHSISYCLHVMSIRFHIILHEFARIWESLQLQVHNGLGSRNLPSAGGAPAPRAGGR